MKKNDKINESYVGVMLQAAIEHGPVAPMVKRFGLVLRGLGSSGVRKPNDWQFHFNGYIELRWHDGVTTFSTSQRWIGLDIMPDTLMVRGRLEKSYDQQGGITIRGLSEVDMRSVLKILVEMLGRPKERGSK